MTQSGIKSRVWRLPLRAAAVFLAAVLATTGQAPAQSAVPPDQLETSRLIWTTLIAVDHANRTGNYSVLRDLSAPSFRDANDAARLAVIFAKLRERDIGLDRVVLTAPVLAAAPAVLENGLYRVTGSFPFRPVGVGFDLLFQSVDGQWRLFGVSVAPLEMAAAEEAEPPAQ
jgi:hypothetical protein